MLELRTRQRRALQKLKDSLDRHHDSGDQPDRGVDLAGFVD
jgi:hypothetical protein